jgi:1-acyl-sn-glycerol-3-phosphate acyltransferase
VTWVTHLWRTLYGFYGWLVFGLCGLCAFLATILVPNERIRHRISAAASRAIFILGGIPAKVQGLENLPESGAVAVANHASFADGFLLRGYLPPRFSFVIKGEMRNIPLVHFLLRRSGSRFVERFDRSGSSRDARQIVKAAVGGQSLVLFPEGTFQREPGVSRFRPGAFVAAVKADLPVVPIAISGTREMLPEGRLWPWPVRPRIEILPAIPPSDPAFENHRVLAETARQRILAVLDEPDLCKVSPPEMNKD